MRTFDDATQKYFEFEKCGFNADAIDALQAESIDSEDVEAETEELVPPFILATTKSSTDMYAAFMRQRTCSRVR